MFLLIGNGFKQSGKRPPTSLAFYTGVKLQIWNGREWHDSSKKLGEVTVYARWEREPTPRQIRWEKARLQPWPAEEGARNPNWHRVLKINDPSVPTTAEAYRKGTA